MKWSKYTLRTTTAATDLISGMLMELGIDGIEIKDNVPLSDEDKNKMFIDFLPELPEDKGEAFLTFYMEETENEEARLEEIRSGLEELKAFVDVGECSIEKGETEDKDWINNWKQFFKSFTVDDIVIKPTWEKVKEEYKGKLVIEIDPGIAFGTGMHETTQLCIKQLKKYVRDDTVILDVGCGSGILSIVSLKLGARLAVGIDIDENAVTATGENLEVNNIPKESCRVYAGNMLEDEKLREQAGFECYDIVVANILADVLIPLSDIVSEHLKVGGYFITSGIIDTKEAEVAKAIENNPQLEIVEITRQNDWSSITARRVCRKQVEVYHFFADKEQIDNEFITLRGSDVNHIKNVLRMKIGDELLISNGIDMDYYCRIDEMSDDIVKARICAVDNVGSELDTEFYLFQCLPKGDKMELIIQKAVELGVKEIIPVASKRAIVKLDEKKADAKVKRWNLISESAAKQSGRIIIPQVKKPMSFEKAVEYAKSLDMSLIPYEKYRDMAATRSVIDKIKSGMKVGIFIGPEGGFDESEIIAATEAGIEKISLGRRILRTETAGMAILAVLMFKMDSADEMELV